MSATTSAEHPAILAVKFLHPKLDKIDKEFIRRNGSAGSRHYNNQLARRLVKYLKYIPDDLAKDLLEAADQVNDCASTESGKPVLEKHNERTFIVRGVGKENRDHYVNLAQQITGKHDAIRYSDEPECPGYYITHRKHVAALLNSIQFEVQHGLKKNEWLWMETSIRHQDAPQVDWPTLSAKRQPKDYQASGVEFMVNGMVHEIGGFLLADEMGLGKTAQAIYLSQVYKRQVVVVCPAGLRHTWASEIFKTTENATVCVWGDRPNPLALNSLYGQDAKRFQVMPDYADFLVMSYEASRSMVCGNPDPITAAHPTMKNVLRPELEYMFKDRILVCDEAHRGRNHNAKRSQAVLALSRGSWKTVALTGTPVDNRPSELWSMLCLIRRTDIFGGKDDFDALTDSREGLLEVNSNLIQSGAFLRRQKKDVIKDLLPKTRQDMSVVMNARQSLEYERLRTELRRAVNGQVKQLTCILAVLTELQTVANEAKVDPVVDELVDRAGEGLRTVVSACRLVPLKAIAEKAGKMGVVCAIISGETSGTERQQIQTDFEAGKILVVLTTLAEGLNLQCADTMFMLDLPWTPGQCRQREDRIHRQGQTEKVTIIRCLAAGIDRHKAEVITKKMTVAEACVDGGDSATAEDDTRDEIIRKILDD